MPIPINQLDSWSHQGAIKGSSSTYQSIKDALKRTDTAFADKDFSVFLQGSYGNDTNIYAESDVDVVVCLNECFRSDISELKDLEKDAWNASYSNAQYYYSNFSKDVLSVLCDEFGDNVNTGHKAIIIPSNGKMRNADVITAIQYRRYYKFNGINDQTYEEGICFYTSKGIEIANYPK